MSLAIVADEKYNALVSDVKSIMTEAIFNSRWFLVQGYWEIGQAIREYSQGDITNLLQDLALDLEKSERTLWYAVQFYDKYPRIDEVPEGKNISWNKLITKYLGGEKKDHHEKELRCPHCNYQGALNEFKL